MTSLKEDFEFPQALQTDEEITILAYGALLSEASSRLTFPDLTHFRHVRVRGLRRVFAHPHVFLIQQGLVGDPADETPTEGGGGGGGGAGPLLRMASLSAEPADSENSSFVVAAFTVTLNDEQRLAFLEREASYDIVSVPFYELSSSSNDDESSSSSSPPLGNGVICLKSTDETNLDLIATLPSSLPYSSIWSWPKDSGLRPADMYLRHCLLAVEKGAAGISSSSSSSGGRAAKESFWNDTYLVDRTTRLGDYLSDPDVYQRVMESRPPPALATRFGG